MAAPAAKAASRGHAGIIAHHPRYLQQNFHYSALACVLSGKSSATAARIATVPGLAYNRAAAS
jgi:hypothetical protein